MEYDTILNKIGGFGKYQKIFLLVVSMASIFNGLTSFALNFAFGEHPHRCTIPGATDEYSSPGQIYLNTTDRVQSYNVTECTIEINGSDTKCENWVYDKSLFEATIISKFNIVCEYKFYRAHVLMAHYAGLLIGSIVGGVLSDVLGRKPVLVIGIMILLLSMGLRPFLPTLFLVSAFEFLNGFGSIISYISPFIILTEMVGPKKRLLASFCVYFTFCIGNYILLILAYFLRDWKHLFWAIAILIGAYSIVTFFIKESPRWLLSRGKKKEAIVILERMSIINGHPITLFDQDIDLKEHQTISFPQFVKRMMKSKQMMVRLAIISFNWFALNLTYYGISMNVAKFGGDIFVNFAVSSLAELLGILFCWFATDRFGRKYFFSISMILSGVLCICTIFTTLYISEEHYWVTTALAMFGKFFNCICFFVVYIFTVELFPTVLRATVIGVSSMIGRIGSISSAYVGELGSVVPNKFGIALPLIILGSVGLSGGLLSLTLPDTTDIKLPESLDDAKSITANNSSRKQREDDTHELESLTEKM